MEMHDRIRILRKECLHLSQTEFGNRLGVSRSVIKNIELNVLARPDQKLSLIKLMCKEFNVNEDWLLNGNEPMFVEPVTFSLDKFMEERGATDIELQIMKTYFELPPDTRKMLVEHFRKSLVQEPVPATDTQVPRRLISYYYRLASAGTGQLLIDNLPEEHVSIPDIPKYKDVSYAISVNGDSMEPMYQDGDVLLVEATRELLIGDIGIFQLDDQCYVKKLGTDSLISLNEKYDNIPLDESARTMGRVVGKLSLSDM